MREAISGEISRRVNSWTLSRSSWRSDWVGGSKPEGCLEEAWRVVGRARGLESGFRERDGRVRVRRHLIEAIFEEFMVL